MFKGAFYELVWVMLSYIYTHVWASLPPDLSEPCICKHTSRISKGSRDAGLFVVLSK